jgi:hypothetical protein
MKKNGNRCELVSFDGLGHSYGSVSKYGPEAKKAGDQTYRDAAAFLKKLGFVSKN